ncbi:hypothetical protein H696_05632 [Fonticula alba]|uniref:SURP motif domain-containing protein n=1 Tax=Fonticula alba TaxID=691883 RepID=A0A058Z1U6_FONAL|nr:hypothetical protein H696_05632 [Fonticula alba]KCV67903.1 hypothetical protein H696_05632 [Fonticula alba]|eukprot:XP_009497723.1 hypothetical protein H696_05632 [Fonticula alba]
MQPSKQRVGLRRNPYREHREEQERKKRRQDEEAARVLADYEEQGTQPRRDADQGSTWVRGGVIQHRPDGRPAATAAEPSAEALYRMEGEPAHMDRLSFMSGAGPGPGPQPAPAVPSARPPAREPATRRPRRATSALFSDDSDESDDSGDDDALPERRRAPAAPASGGGARHRAPSAPVGSTVSSAASSFERSQPHRTAFICFMDTGSADKAQSHMNGALFNGHTLRVNLSKPVAVTGDPIYDPNLPQLFGARLLRADRSEEARALARQGARNACNASAHEAGGPVGRCGVAPSPEVLWEVPVRIPECPDTRQRIHRTVSAVLERGYPFEAFMAHFFARNPDYAFLQDFHSPEHAYYRWRLFHLSRADSLEELDSWPEFPFLLNRSGPVWIPPSRADLLALVREEAARARARQAAASSPAIAATGDPVSGLLAPGAAAATAASPTGAPSSAAVSASAEAVTPGAADDAPPRPAGWSSSAATATATAATTTVVALASPDAGPGALARPAAGGPVGPPGPRPADDRELADAGAQLARELPEDLVSELHALICRADSSTAFVAMSTAWVLSLLTHGQRMLRWSKEHSIDRVPDALARLLVAHITAGFHGLPGVDVARAAAAGVPVTAAITEDGLPVLLSRPAAGEDSIAETPTDTRLALLHVMSDMASIVVATGEAAPLLFWRLHTALEARAVRAVAAFARVRRIYAATGSLRRAAAWDSAVRAVVDHWRANGVFHLRVIDECDRSLGPPVVPGTT